MSTICTRDEPNKEAKVHTVTPHITSVLTHYGPTEDKHTYQIITDYWCVFCGLEVKGVQRAAG